MKEFRFNLERILALRRYTEREWEIRLAEATRPCIELSGRIREAVRQRSEELERRFSGGLSSENLVASHLYTSRLEQETERHRIALERAEEERIGVQQKYLDAQRNRKVLDKVKERQADDYRILRIREEVAENDEIGATLSSPARLKGESGG